MEIEKAVKDILKTNKIISIETEPVFSLYIFEESPLILIKDHKENLVKFSLVSEVVEYINFLSTLKTNRFGSLKNITFLEEGTRLKTPNLEIVEKKPKKFKIKFLKKGSKKIIEKDFKVPGRVWLKTNKEVLLFFIKKWEDEKTVLYQSPFPNTFSDGRICWGIKNSKIENIKNTDDLDRLYFEETIFTPDNNRTVYKNKKVEYSSIEFIEKFNRFPGFNNLTVPTETLENVILNLNS